MRISDRERRNGSLILPAKRGDVSAAVLITALLLAACHRERAANATLAEVRRAADAPTASSDPRIPCATGTAPLAPDCTFSREATPAGLVVTIQRADGGFRRLLVTNDGRGVVAADGAQPARVSVAGPDQIEVALGGDRYRLPATIRARPK